jgi:hypothetical protein
MKVGVSVGIGVAVAVGLALHAPNMNARTMVITKEAKRFMETSCNRLTFEIQ